MKTSFKMVAMLLGIGIFPLCAYAQQKVVIEDEEPNSIMFVSKNKAGDEIIRIMNDRSQMRFHDPNAPRFLLTDQKGKFALGIGGYVRATAEYDFNGIVNDVDFYPALIPIQPKVTGNTPNVNPRDFLTEEILMSNSTAKMAELVAKEIYSIRESKNALLRGEADNMPKDGAQLKLMLDNLTLQERAMTEMFAGKVTTEEKIYTIRIVPKEMKHEVAFRFSKKLGIVANNDLAGEPVYITIADLKSINIPEADPKKQVDGIAYNVPGRARVTLDYHNEELYNAEIPITQFGVVEYLAPVLFNKNSVIKVLFDTNTGALVKVDRGE